MRFTYPVAALVGVLVLSACSTDRDAHHHGKKHNLEAQNYSLTYEQVREAAQDGDADAQYALGYMYYYGQNVTRNGNQARYWIRKAAAQHHQQAVKALKMMGPGDRNLASQDNVDSAQTVPARNLANRQNTWQEVRRPREAADQAANESRNSANADRNVASNDNVNSPQQYRQSFKMNNGGTDVHQGRAKFAAEDADAADNPSAAKQGKHHDAQLTAAERKAALKKSTLANSDETATKGKVHLTPKERRLAKKNNALHGKNLAKGGSSKNNRNRYAASRVHHDAQAATTAADESAEPATTAAATTANDDADAHPPVGHHAKTKGQSAKVAHNQPATTSDETDDLANADEAPDAAAHPSQFGTAAPRAANANRSASTTAQASPKAAAADVDENDDEESTTAAKGAGKNSAQNESAPKLAQLKHNGPASKLALNHANANKAQKTAEAHHAKPSLAAHDAHNKFALKGKATHDEHHIMSQPSTHYTLQLIGGGSKSSIQQIVERNHLQQKAKIYHTNLNGKDFYVLIYGSYPTPAAAAAEISRLPASLQQLKPWVKPYSAVKAGIKAATEETNNRTR